MPAAVQSRAKKDPNEIEQYYTDVIACMPNVVYLLDRNCTLTGCNKNFCRLIGLEYKEEILGGNFYKRLITKANWSKERVDVLKRDDINALLSAEPAYDVEEAPVIDEEANASYYLSSRVPLLNKNKEVIGLVVILTDVTEQVMVQEELEQLKQDLNENSARLQNTLAKANYNEEYVENRKPPRVLMVEDNSVAQKAAQALLMQLDCHVDVADSGDKAAALFEPGKYDLVFMDIGLEDTSGYVVSKRIRQSEKGTDHHVPIIALTGFEADVIKYDCDDYSMEGALTKPLTSEQAKQIIQHYIYHIDIPVRGLKTIKGHTN